VSLVTPRTIFDSFLASFGIRRKLRETVATPARQTIMDVPFIFHVTAFGVSVAGFPNAP
jgi:hypothetical protein